MTNQAPNAKKKKNQQDKDEIFEAPTILREPTSRQVKLKGKLTLRIVATGRPLPSYQWYHNGRKISGANSDRLVVNKIRRDQGGAYHCEVKNYAGKAVSRQAMVSFLMQKIPDPVIEPVIAQVPAGKPFTFRMVVPAKEQAKGFRLQWVLNGKRITGAHGTELEFTQVKQKYQGEYKLLLICGAEVRSSNVVKLNVVAEDLPVQEVPSQLLPAAMRPAPQSENWFFNPEEEEDLLVPEEAPQAPVASAPALREQPKLPEVSEHIEATSFPRPVLVKKKSFLEQALQKVQTLRKAPSAA